MKVGSVLALCHKGVLLSIASNLEILTFPIINMPFKKTASAGCCTTNRFYTEAFHIFLKHLQKQCSHDKTIQNRRTAATRHTHMISRLYLLVIIQESLYFEFACKQQ